MPIQLGDQWLAVRRPQRLQSTWRIHTDLLQDRRDRSDGG